MPSMQRNEDRRKDVRTLTRVGGAFRPYRWKIFGVGLFILLSSLLALVDPFVVRAIFDDAIGKRNVRLLVALVSLMVAVPLIRGVIDIWESYLTNRIGQGVMRDFRRDMYAHLQRMSLHFFTVTRTGEIQSRLSNDIGGVEAFVTFTAPAVVSNIATAISGAIGMVVISPLLTLISIGLLPMFVWITGRVGKVRRTTSEETQNCVARLTALMQETLSVSGVLLLKTHGRQQYAQERFDAENQRLTELEIKQHMVGRWLFMLVDALFSLTPAIIFLVAGIRMINNPEHARVTLGGIVAFTALQMRLFSPVEQLLHVRVEIQGALALFDRIFEYLDLPVEIHNAHDAIELRPEDVRGRISFREVSFTYCGDHFAPTQKECQALALGRPPTLHNVSFEVCPGQLVALVGPSGAGKTTITYLLARLYDVDSGAVAIDGYNVKQIDLASLGQLIGVVTQETYLFHTSIRENLLFARPDANDQEMISACTAAAIHERISQLPEAYDTIVGERGYKLSGGEKQRLAIARVILKNPRILVLDEATSSLDTCSERLIQAALEPLTKQRTTLAIAHRLSTVMRADQILVLDKGTIVERGTHEQLLQRGGAYTRLYREQFSRVPAREMVA